LSTVDLSKIASAVAWGGSRAKIEASVREVLGFLPDKREEPQVKVIDEFAGPGYTRKRVNYFVDEWTRVSAWLFVPDGRDEMPGILCCHRAVPQAKEEMAGLAGDASMALAKHFAELGYVTLAPDCITAGERVSNRLGPYDTASFYRENPRMSLMGKMLLDHMRSVDAFAEVSQVDSARIGVAGHGLGGTNALLLAAMDDRVLVCAASCGFTRFEKDKEVSRWALEDGMVLLPGLRPHVEAGAYPFDWEHILAMAAPSALLVLSSLTDAEGSNPKSCQQAVNRASKVFKLLGAGGGIEHYAHDAGDRLTPEGMDLMDDWFDRWL